MTEADCLLYATHEDIELCPADEFDIAELFDAIATENEVREEATTALDGKHDRRQRYARRKAFQASKIHDHRCFGKHGWVGGNPRYNDDARGWRSFDTRHASKLALAAAIADAEQAEADEWADALDDYYAELEWEQQYEWDIYDDYEGEGSDEWYASEAEDWDALRAAWDYADA